MLTVKHIWTCHMEFALYKFIIIIIIVMGWGGYRWHIFYNTCTLLRLVLAPSLLPLPKKMRCPHPTHTREGTFQGGGIRISGCYFPVCTCTVCQLLPIWIPIIIIFCNLNYVCLTVTACRLKSLAVLEMSKAIFPIATWLHCVSWVEARFFWTSAWHYQILQRLLDSKLQSEKQNTRFPWQLCWSHLVMS